MMPPDGDPPTGSDLPPEPPKHSAPEPPLPLHQRVTATEDAIHTTATGTVIAGAVAFLALILVVIVGALYMAQRSTISDLQTRQNANDVERARVDGMQRNAMCTTLVALRATKNAAARNAFPGGAGGYDQLFAAFDKSAAELDCDAG